MTRQSRKLLVKVGMCTDLILCSLSLLLASAFLYEPLWEADAILLHNPLRELLMTAALGFSWHLSLIATGAYDSYRLPGLWRQITALLRGSALLSLWVFVWLCASVSGPLVPLRVISQEVAIFWGLSLSSMLLIRVIASFFARSLRRRGRNLRNILIIGSNRRAVALADHLLMQHSLGLRLVGFVDDLWQDDDAPESYKAMLIGNSNGLLELLRNLAIDEVILTLPIASKYHFSRRVIGWCRQQGIPVRSEGSLFDHHAQAHDHDQAIPHTVDLITHHEVVHSQWSVVCKRLVDILLSGAALILLSPILLLIALAVRFTSVGPILFKQQRLGVNKRLFHIWKFRTMVVDAEARMAQVEHLNQTSGPTFKLTNDPRITRIGSFLRKTSLDELPQLFNVLIGDMSLVGPRPLPLRDYRGFSADWHRRRFSVKPGITCLWQIMGRSTIGFDRWMELDMDYIDHWSIWLDLEILVKTIPVVLRGSGAV